MSWTQKHVDRIREAVHELKMKYLFEDDVEDELDELFESIQRMENVLQYLETRDN